MREAPHKRHQRHQRLCFVAALIVLVCMLAGMGNDFLMDLESRTWDWRVQQTASPRHADPRIKLILIDQESLDYWERREQITWPWPRSLYIPVMQYLAAAGVRGVAFDLLFTESSAWGTDEDRKFADALNGRLPVVSAVVAGDGGGSETEADIRLFRQRQLESLGDSPFPRWRQLLDLLPPAPSVSLPVHEIMQATTALGNVAARPDRDGVFRHYTVGASARGIPILNLPFALFEASGGGQESLAVLRTWTDSQQQLTVRFHGASGTYPSFPIESVMRSGIQMAAGESPTIPLDTFRGAFVFVGVSAPGLLDLRPSPVSDRYLGVEYHATVLDNLLHGNFVRPFSFVQNALYGALWVLGVTYLLLVARRWVTQLAGAILIAVLFVGSAYLLAANGVWVHLVWPAIGTMVTAIVLLALQYLYEGREHRFVTDAFKHYVSPLVIQELVSDPSRLVLGGERRELTMFFSDIVGFTSISERMDPPRLAQLLNAYFSEMTEILLTSGGTLDKYQGDAMIAFWNAPLPVPDHAARAVRAAIECQQRLTQRRAEWKQRFGVELYQRIGLHTGIVSVGNFGSATRFNYTMIGDGANVASRLEGANKLFETSILLSEAVFHRLNGEVPCRRLGAIRVVGREAPIQVYEPVAVGALAQTGNESLQTFARSIEAWERGDLTVAEAGFQQLVHDSVSRQYLERLARERAQRASSERSVIWELGQK